MQILVNGLLGAIGIVPIARAFAVVYVPTRVFHIALAGIYAFAPYTAWALMKAGAPVPLALAGAIIGAVVLSLLLEICNHGPLEKKARQPLAHFIASMGAYILIVQVIVLGWGPDPQTLRPAAQTTFIWANLVITTGQIAALMVAVVAAACFYGWLAFTGSGLRLRALASNPAELALRGHNVRRLRLLAFGVSGALCSGAALVASWDMGFDPHSGLSPVLLGIVAAILGGRQSFWGPALGMLVIGLARVGVLVGVSARWQDPAVFLLLALGLYCRPNGILTTATRDGGAP